MIQHPRDSEDGSSFEDVGSALPPAAQGSAATIRGPRSFGIGLILFYALLHVLGLSPASAETVNLLNATVILPAPASAIEQQAAVMLVEEVEKRTGTRWGQASDLAAAKGPRVILGTLASLSQAGEALGEVVKDFHAGPAEGFQLTMQAGPESPTLLVIGNDARGVMFGVGRLLRELEMASGQARLASDFQVTTAPAYRLRGHQLGYRPKTNSYDAWDVTAWEQYFRDLIIFGCNAVELIPPRSDDAADSPHFPKPPLAMMIEMSRLADRYGLDVWIWYPAMDKDYSNPATVTSALEEWNIIFKALPRINAVLVPGGDPGHTQPRYLMPLLERQARNLRQTHPGAEMWVSPQSFDKTWLDEFVSIVRTDRPAWLSGIVFGPQVRVPLPELRRLIPAEYPIRHYPDITHSRQCQYPVPNWDVAFAITEARECVNPRPLDEAQIFHATQPFTIGFITYSEGCNDDVNKAIWSALGWNPEAKPEEILREYGRYFIGPQVQDDFAQGLLALERNWRGPLLANAEVEVTLRQFQALEKAATPAQLRNWRFQQALYRAYYDAYVRRRLVYETDLELQALTRLDRAEEHGSLMAMTEAERILNRAVNEPVGTDLHERILELGGALFQSIGMQLSVAKYRAIAVDRGANLDTLEFPLNNRPWLKEQFALIRALPKEPERLKAVRQLVDWENPGPGGYYDDLGHPGRQPHLVSGLPFDQDPGSFQSARAGFEEDLVTDDDDPTPEGHRRVSWLDHAETLYDQPLVLRYRGLDPKASYKVRVVYAGDSPRRTIALTANGSLQIHPQLTKPMPFHPLEFALPGAATADGSLTLTWSTEQGLGGNGRGCQVSEVWLLKVRQD